MSDLDSRPAEALCTPAPGPGPVTEFFTAREVPLGGVRGVYVERVLPQRDLPTVGAWCFLDHFGAPTVTRTDAPSNIEPHPHIGLQTVTWPFVGRIRHRDSVGSDVEIEPGQLNLMTSGRGIAHSEYYATDAPASEGLQLWIALPGHSAGVAPHFEQHRDLPVHEAPGLRAIVLTGTLAGHTSPATTYTPIVGADIRIAPGADVALPIDPSFEHAVLAVAGEVTVAATSVRPGPLLYLGSDRSELRLSSATGAHLVLIGGEPFGEELVMWWNFVGRTHEEIVAARTAWENRDTTWFSDIAGHTPQQRIPAPPMPPVTLRPRIRRIGDAARD
ncbi:pirin family protein [Nocardia higoensis]|uniref:Pirin family protein n=1 Tax=Nocardia higoensis TaxID=228599 RepID=A0ABS0DB09_9NOCA|nr:pirin family protein [Nocardia higoensis]MBF6355650.1 pirin family protein [Nocardia higoensis]